MSIYFKEPGMGLIFVKDSLIEEEIKKEMELQRLYGKKETIESHLKMCRDNGTVHAKLLESLTDVNDQILKIRSEAK